MSPTSPLRPTREQSLASDPSQSVWVSASAGTGKTRILVNRMLRLMLQGSAPEKLLCITFTKAAAAEVLQRIQDTVLTWSVATEEKLTKEMQQLLERAATREEIKRARRLLPLILQARGGMKIMTIHAFCQSVLSRFPLEAQVTPGFAILDEAQSQSLLNQAKYRLLEETSAENDPVLFADLSRFFDRVYESNQNALIQSVLLKRYRLTELATHSLDDIRQRLCAIAGVSPDILDTNLQDDFVARIPVDTIRSLIPELQKSKNKTPHKNAESFALWLQHGNLTDYTGVFLTKTNTIQKNLLSGIDAPWAVEFLENEAQRVFDHIQMLHKVDLVRDTFSLLHICLKIMAHYQQLKKLHSVLDYEDQILLTSQLLQNPLDSQWVHYKLDGGIDHILVDEAQDTSPAQWNIIKGITEEFFSGNARHQQGERTLFVVGDEKQSIFSFQNADPIEFSHARHFFADKAKTAQAAWQDISLIDNFRSAPLILKMTDQVFSAPHMAAHIAHHATAVTHHAFHQSRTGQIEIWPLLQPVENENYIYTQSNEYLLADAIATQVDTWLKERKLLSDGRIMQPGDVMILVRTRTPMVSPLTKAFKDRNIPVTSADRLVLSEQLAVQDCLTAIQSALHPDDDYALSCFLKSPFIGFSEQQLYALCANRPGTVWESLLQSDHDWIVRYLKDLAWAAREKSPGHFIHCLLSHQCPADPRSGRHALITRLGYECDDVLDELIATAYQFDQQENPTCQSFVTAMQNNNTTIKRANSEMDKSRVQIMTAHASKGLQAPIVFLADAHAKPGNYKNTRDVLWQEQFDNGFLWATGAAQKTDVFLAEKEKYLAAQYSEYYRLLYVALTRAEEKLVICGIQKKTNGHKDYQSWYEASQTAIGQLQHDPAYETQSFTRFGQDGTILIQHGKKPETVQDIPDVLKQSKLPLELLLPPDEEPKRFRPLRPSRPTAEDPPVFSPLQPKQNDSYRRGQILHTLFRLVPDYPRDEQEEALYNLVRHHVPDPAEQQQITEEVMNVLHHPEFAHLFTPQARAEVPIVGEVQIDGEFYAISGQIDRLLVEADRVLIVDYKTNRPPVLDAALIPAAYRHQLHAYKTLMQKIYPDRKIETALLWTSLPFLLPVPV